MKDKKVSSKANTQEIIKLKDFTEEFSLPPEPNGPAPSFPEDERPEITLEYEEDEGAGEQRLQKLRVPKVVYRIGVILLAVILGLIVWLNWQNLTPESIWNWIQLQTTGTGTGDGFPVTITGSSVNDSNFTQHNGTAAVLSDTTFVLLNNTGKEILSLRHSLSNPALCASGGRYLMFNAGSTGYIVQSGTKTVVNGAADKEILAGAVAENGRYALGLQGADSASRLQVFQKDGTLQYEYLMAKDYITAVAFSPDATQGIVCAVHSEKGEMVSKIFVFDFMKDEPIATFETRNNLLIGAYWSDNGTLYGIGDSALVMAKSYEYEFTEQGYDGRKLTAMHFGGNKVYLSISAYDHAGPSTLAIFSGDTQSLKIEAENRIESLSASGGTIGALIDGQVVFYDSTTGTELARAPAGSDARSISLMNERSAYVLGVSEIRTVSVNG